MYQSTQTVIKDHLFSDIDVIDRAGIALPVRDRILRIRSMYEYHCAFPSKSSSELVTVMMGRYHIKKTQAYMDLKLIREFIGQFNHTTKDFERWKINEELDTAYRMAKTKGDVKAIAAIAREQRMNNNTDKEDGIEIPYEEIVPQQFIPTVNPEILGIKAIPNFQAKKNALIKQFSSEIISEVKPDLADIDEDIINRTPIKLEEENGE